MASDHVDVLIVGAGLSGIGAAHHLHTTCPGKSVAIIESRERIGGTWDLFRYPGIRSDSDMYTLGYEFRPWTGTKAIADGDSILEYVRDTAREDGTDEKVRFGTRAVAAQWSTADSRWTVELEQAGERSEITCGFLMMCTGYYRYDEGYTPPFAGTDRFEGQIVHPQHWPEDLDYADKNVIVIGSGATAVTLVPSLAQEAKLVTMLQRSPSYVVSRPARDPLAVALGDRIPPRFLYPIVRWKNVLLTSLSYNLSRKRPGLIKTVLRKALERQLPADYDIEKHFTPTYNPWDQRLCLVPDGDLFRAIRHDKARVVTDRIETFTEQGLRLESGDELEADIVVTATGLNLLAFGGIELTVDEEPVDLAKTMGYKGIMLSNVPNMSYAIGYTNASWTLKADLAFAYTCRLLNHMDANSYAKCVPVNDDPTVTELPMIDFNSGYVLRAIESFPKQGSRTPWRLHQNYARDIALLRRGKIEDQELRFSKAATGKPQLVTPS